MKRALLLLAVLVMMLLVVNSTAFLGKIGKAIKKVPGLNKVKLPGPIGDVGQYINFKKLTRKIKFPKQFSKYADIAKRFNPANPIGFAERIPGFGKHVSKYRGLVERTSKKAGGFFKTAKKYAQDIPFGGKQIGGVFEQVESFRNKIPEGVPGVDQFYN